MFFEKKTSLSVIFGVLATLALTGLSACTNTPPDRPSFAQLTYGHLGKFVFEAARVEIADETGGVAGNVSAPVNPDRAGRQWAQDRIAVTGQGAKTVRVVIRNAAITESELPRAGGLRSAFTKEQAQRFDAKIEMVVEVRNERGFQEGFAGATAERSTTVAEDITLNDRDRILFGLVEMLMQDMNGRMDGNIRSFLAIHLR